MVKQFSRLPISGLRIGSDGGGILRPGLNHYNFHRISQHSDFYSAATALLARFGHFFEKSSQVPCHEPFTHEIGFSQSCLIKANRV
jgi:hypothetical protein